MTRRIVAERDGRLTARIRGSTQLLYEEEARPDPERPPYVRAGSSLARIGGRIAVIEDDANFIALIAPDSRRADYIRLPPGPGGHRVFDEEHGNKGDKLDLEACVTIHDEGVERLVALGSGSGPERERIVVASAPGGGEPEIEVYHAPAFYAALREERAFSGSALNVEGVIVLPGGVMRLYQRGNGEPRDGVEPVNATADLDWPALLAHLRAPETRPAPALHDVVRYELGRLDGVRLGFSDAELYEGLVLFSASAEDDAGGGDGRVTGSVLGVIDESGARWTELTDTDGGPFRGKIEGLHLSPDDARLMYFVVDEDDTEKPSELYEAELEGPWHAG